MTSIDDPAPATVPASRPSSPEQDYAAAAYAIWRHMRETADPGERKYNGRPGVWWYGSASKLIREWWPHLSVNGTAAAWNAVRDRLYSAVNVALLKPGANQKPSKFWVSDTWNGPVPVPVPVPVEQAAQDAPQVVDQAPQQDPYADIQRVIDEMVASRSRETRAKAREALASLAEGLEGLSSLARKALDSME